MRKIVVRLLLLLVAPSAFAHGGGLDRNGCHTNRKTGDYHCHGAPSASPPPESPAPRPNLVTAPTTGKRDLVRAAQVLLHGLGYHPSLLGSLDARTKAAIQAFQRTEQLEPDGAVTEFLVLRLAEKIAATCE